MFRYFDPNATKLINYKEFIKKIQEINIDLKGIIE